MSVVNRLKQQIERHQEDQSPHLKYQIAPGRLVNSTKANIFVDSQDFIGASKKLSPPGSADLVLSCDPRHADPPQSGVLQATPPPLLPSATEMKRDSGSLRSGKVLPPPKIPQSTSYSSSISSSSSRTAARFSVHGPSEVPPSPLSFTSTQGARPLTPDMKSQQTQLRRSATSFQSLPPPTSRPFSTIARSTPTVAPPHHPPRRLPPSTPPPALRVRSSTVSGPRQQLRSSLNPDLPRERFLKKSLSVFPPPLPPPEIDVSKIITASPPNERQRNCCSVNGDLGTSLEKCTNSTQRKSLLRRSSLSVSLAEITDIYQIIEVPIYAVNLLSFMKSEYAHESLLFFLEARSFRTLVESPDVSQDDVIQEGKRIYQLYFDENSELEVNISGVCSAQLKQKIAEGRIDVNFFKTAETELSELIKTHSLPRWIAARRGESIAIEDESSSASSILTAAIATETEQTYHSLGLETDKSSYKYPVMMRNFYQRNMFSKFLKATQELDASVLKLWTSIEMFSQMTHSPNKVLQKEAKNIFTAGSMKNIFEKLGIAEADIHALKDQIEDETIISLNVFQLVHILCWEYLKEPFRQFVSAGDSVQINSREKLRNSDKGFFKHLFPRHSSEDYNKKVDLKHATDVAEKWRMTRNILGFSEDSPIPNDPPSLVTTISDPKLAKRFQNYLQSRRMGFALDFIADAARFSTGTSAQELRESAIKIAQKYAENGTFGYLPEPIKSNINTKLFKSQGKVSSSLYTKPLVIIYERIVSMFEAWRKTGEWKMTPEEYLASHDDSKKREFLDAMDEFPRSPTRQRHNTMQTATLFGIDGDSRELVAVHKKISDNGAVNWIPQKNE